MTNRALITTISRSDISKATILIQDKAVYIKKRTCQTSREGKKHYSTFEYIILLNKSERVGGIFIMGDTDLHFYIFKKFRGMHHLSQFMKSGWLRKIRPDLKKITCMYETSSEDYGKIKHLADLAGFKIEYNQWGDYYGL